MPALLRTIAVAVLLPVPLAAAQAVVEAPERTDALAVFARQAATAVRPSGPAPAPIGLYLWGGRADIDYRPFFQWELRLQGGTEACAHLRARIATLSPTRTVLVQGEWADWPALAAGRTEDVHYRTHCPTFSAYQLDLSWSGGAESYIANDKGAIPIPLGSVKDQGCAIAVNVATESEPGAATTVITWTDWNIGGRPAQGVVHTLHLRDDKLAEVKAIKLPLKGALAAGAVAAQKATLQHLPAFATCSISVEESEETVSSEPAGFTTVQDIEIAEVRAAAGRLEAKVRNGLATAVDGVVVSLTLQDRQGKTLATLELPAGHLAPGEIKRVSAPLAGVANWASYESSWKGGPAAQAAAAPAAAGTAGGPATSLPPAVEADHLRFTAEALDHQPVGWLLSGHVANHRGRSVGPLDVRLQLQDRSGSVQEVVCRTGVLEDGAEAAVAFACSLADIARMQLSWQAVPAGP